MTTMATAAEDGLPDLGDDDAGTPELRTFGRRRGRKISARQQSLVDVDLPTLRLDLKSDADGALRTAFPQAREVWLEIGFGGGEHLLAQARAHPHVGLIGCEPYQDGVVKVLTAIAAERLSNIRLWDDDARDVLRWLRPASVARAFVLFPDPWPKRKHQKRRLVNQSTLALLARVMKPGGELRIATDIPDYLRSTFIAFHALPEAFSWSAESPADWRQRSPDWPSTKYEAKANREGRRSTFLRFMRR
jgi:tRNA (guanine-N7-)-methyltransferase